MKISFQQARREIGATRARCSLEPGYRCSRWRGNEGLPVDGPLPEAGRLEPSLPGWPDVSRLRGNDEIAGRGRCGGGATCALMYRRAWACVSADNLGVAGAFSMPGVTCFPTSACAGRLPGAFSMLGATWVDLRLRGGGAWVHPRFPGALAWSVLHARVTWGPSPLSGGKLFSGNSRSFPVMGSGRGLDVPPLAGVMAAWAASSCHVIDVWHHSSEAMVVHRVLRLHYLVNF